MKVLFAVNSESVSESIIKKYQKEYKEILTYKNVYYFNAILKELQKDKTYDRIVISEDLEPFANNNYDVIDKFLFEKLDNISDEATDLNGNDVPIILICTDRRSKSDNLLVKLFGIGIYSAIIGKDRSIDEVCRLINMPRTKKEAKQYYRIEADEVTYQVENESDVSEVEIQNILMHYKRLGKNTERYVDSFNNIAGQYTDAQLKVIAKFLPLNVKAILEAESPKYQELMTTGTKGKANKESSDTRKSRDTRIRPEDVDFDAFHQEERNIFSKPVVIPSTLNTKKTVKLTGNKENKIANVTEKRATQSNSMKNTTSEHHVLKRVERQPQKNIENEQEKEAITTAEITPVKRGRGRPRKTVAPEPIPEETIEPVKRGRGRPKKVLEQQEDDVWQELEEIPKKKQVTYQEPKDINLFDLEQEEPDMFGIEPGEQTNLYEEQGRTQNTVQNQTQIQSSYNSVQNYQEQTVLVSGEGKIVSFVGTSKNGTSFILNNLALIFSNMGIKTAILDTTENKNSYYIYTKNDENLRMQTNDSIVKLAQGITGGITTNKNLSVYTAVPGEKIEENWVKILDTLSKEYSLVLVDCDFETDINIFKNSQETYLVQSMDILTIQPLTGFLRELKNNGALDTAKLRIIINKYEKVRNISPKILIGGMAYYNDPSMSFMTELFNKDNIQYTVLPLDLEVYLKYLESLVTCDISTKGYTKSFMSAINELAGMVYPLLNKKEPKTKYKSFSSNMDQTLNKMRNNY